MRAVILAAGRGSRMGALGDSKPKCLTELAGQTLLSRQCAALRDAGVTRIGIVAGYQGERFVDSGLKLFTNPRWAESNMVVSLTCAAPWLREDTCIVSYADIFYSAATVRRLVGSGDDIAITYDPAWRRLWERRFADPLSDAETFKIDADGWIKEIGGRPKTIEDVQGQYMGLLRFTPHGWARIESHLAGLSNEARDRLHVTGMLMQLIGGGTHIRGLPIDEQWGEIDTPSDLAAYEAMIRDGELTL